MSPTDLVRLTFTHLYRPWFYRLSTFFFRCMRSLTTFDRGAQPAFSQVLLSYNKRETWFVLQNFWKEKMGESFNDGREQGRMLNSLWSVPPWFSVHLKSIATFLAKKLVQNAKEGSVDERSTHWHLWSANSASVSSLATQWRRIRVGTQRLTSAVPQLQWLSYSINTVVHIGKQRRSKPKICPSSRTKRQPMVMFTAISACKKCEWWGRRERAPVTKNRSPTKRHAETDIV